MKKFSLIVLAFISLTIGAFAQNETGKSDRSSQIYIETDPTALFFEGFSLAVRRSSTLIENLNVGIGVYKTTLPEFYIEENENHVGKGWQARNIGVDAFIDYHLFDANKGFTVGSILSVYQFTVGRNNKEASYNSFVATARFGYLWRPIKKFNGLYVYPWVGLSTGGKVSGSNNIDGESFVIPK